MSSLIDLAVDRTRTIVLLFLLILITGIASYLNIPKESNPDIDIPIIYVSIHHEGISPEDAERLLVRPIEQEVKSIEGIKEMRSNAYESGGSVTLEFDAGFDPDQAILDVREKVDAAKSKLPAESDEPTVHEINLALFPIITVILSGPIPEPKLIEIGKNLQDDIEGIPGILEAEIAGNREEMIEILVDPIRMESYAISESELFLFVARNNQLVAAGNLDTGFGRFAIKVPGVFETVEDVFNLPIKTNQDKVVRFKDIATIRRTYKDRSSYARINTQPSIALDISKRVGTNIIDMVDQIKKAVQKNQSNWPQELEVTYFQDQSKDIRSMVSDLENNVIIAVLLVAMIIISALGIRTATLVTIAIPGSFLIGILALEMMDLTVNVVVLFSLIMAVGMLVDGSIVVTEFADRRMNDGTPKKQAYKEASKRMAWPIIAATATTLAAFMPLLFWPGTTGEFMKYMPITLIGTLSASLLMALIFVPTFGGLFGKASASSQKVKDNLLLAESGDVFAIKGITGWYVKILDKALNKTLLTLGLITTALVAIFFAYAVIGKGIEFFPDVEPDYSIINIRARGDLSLEERDQIVKQVEERLLPIPEIETIYSQTITGSGRSDQAEDVIGSIQIQFVNWKKRERNTVKVLESIRKDTADIAGIIVETRYERAGAGGGTKPINIQLTSTDPQLLDNTTNEILNLMDEIGGYVDIEDSRPMPGIEWQVNVDRYQAARFGADVSLVGSFVQLVTNGIKLGEYRPDDVDEELDIRVRYPQSYRHLGQLNQLRMQTQSGYAPAANFVTVDPQQKVGTIKRIDGERILTVSADVIARPNEDTPAGALINKRTLELQEAVNQTNLPNLLNIKFRGQQEEQAESQAFLFNAFIIAIFIMGIILVTQFNSIYQAFLILTAVIFSIGGVLLGLIITQQPFGIVMCGVGVISLAGIVVNNNIVLIDTFNILKKSGMNIKETIIRTGAQRLRPVLLTTITTILGLLPMVLAITINLFEREVTIGAPATQWWTQLATSVAGGLAFASLLTLVLTPCLIYLPHKIKHHIAAFRQHNQK